MKSRPPFAARLRQRTFTTGRALLIAVSTFALAACDNSDKATPVTVATSTPATAATETSSPTTLPTATPTPTPDPRGIPVPSMVQLIETSTGKATTLFESMTARAFAASFEGDEAIVYAGSRSGGPVEQRFDLDGSLAPDPTARECREVDGSAEIDARLYPGVACGPISPDGRWMTYEVDATEITLPSGYVVPSWDQWLVDLASGETRELQPGLVHCGGCDAKWSVSWSPNSRYLAFAELAGEERSFVAEVSGGTARPLGHGTQIGDKPSWSPDGDRIAYRVDAHPATLARVDDLAAGTSHDLDIPWPVAFDPSSAYLYSPSWTYEPKGESVSTTIVDAASGELIDTLSGVPVAIGIEVQPKVIGRAPDGYVIALQGAAACEGTAIYRQGVTAPQCVADGATGVVSADGALVAVARNSGAIGRAYGPGFETIELPLYDVDLVDTASGRVTTVVRGAPSFAPPLLVVNGAGTHVLVVWPRTTGL